MGKPPREIATVLAAAIGTDDVIAKVEVAGPGFVNIFLAPAYVERALDEIRVAGMAYGPSHGHAPAIRSGSRAWFTASHNYRRPRRSTSNSSAPIPPGRSTWAMRAARSWA